MAERKVSVRFTAEGVEAVRAGVKAMGAEGEEALKKFGAGGRDGDQALAKLGQRLGVLERGLDPVARAAAKVAAAQDLMNKATAAGAVEIDRFAAVVAKAQAAHAAAQTTAANFARASQQMVQGANAAGNAVRLQSYQVTNLSYQLQDAATQLAGGASPFLIIAQQGPQAVSAVGGVSAAFQLLAGVIRAHPLLAIGSTIAAVVGGFALLRDSTKAATEAAIDHAEAMAKANDVLATTAERAAKAAASQRGEAERYVEASRRQQQEQLDDIEKQIEQSEALLKGLRERLAKEAGPLGAPEIEAAIKTEIDQLTRLKTEAFELRGLIGQAGEKLERFRIIARGVAGEDANGPLKAWLSLFEEAPKVIEQARTTAQTYAAEVTRLNAMHQVGAIDAETLARAVENLNNWVYESSTASKAASEQAKHYYDELVKTEKAMTEAYNADVKLAEQIARRNVPALEAYGEQIANIDRLFSRDLLTVEEYTRATENLNQWLQEQDPAFQAAKKSAEDYAKSLERVKERAADRVTDFAADAIFDRLQGKNANLWATFETLGKRAIAQVAAESLVRPITISIMSSVTQALPALFGLQQQGAGFSFASLAANPGLSAAGSFGSAGGTIGAISAALALARVGMGASLFAGSPMVSQAFGQVGNFFGGEQMAFDFSRAGSAFSSPINSIGSFAVNLVLDKILGNRGIGSSIGSTVGAIAGSFLPIPGGTIIGSAIGNLIGGLFGGKASVGPNANAVVNYGGGKVSVGGVGADNQGDPAIAREMAEAATKGINAVIDRLGASLTGLPGAGDITQTQVGYFKGKYFSMVGGARSEFESGEEAVADFIRRALTTATTEGISEDVRVALQRSTAKTTEALGEDIEYGATFRRNVVAALAGPGTRAAQLADFSARAEDNGNAQAKAIREFISKADELYGAGSTRSEEARAAMRAKALGLVGMGPDTEGANAPLEGVAATIAEVTANFRALKPALIATGLAAADAEQQIDQGLLRTFGKMADEMVKQIGDATLAIDAPAAAQAKELLKQQEQRRKDLIDLQRAAGRTIDTSSADKLSASERTALIKSLNLTGLGDIARNLNAITSNTTERETLIGEVEARATKLLGEAVLGAQSPAAAQAKALGEAQATRRADILAIQRAANPGQEGLSQETLNALDTLDRLEGGAALIGLTAAQLNEVTDAMGGVAAMSAPMRAALALAKDFAEVQAKAGQLSVDIARWAYEANQAQQAVATAEQAAAEAKNVYIEALNNQIGAEQQAADARTRIVETLKKTRLGLLLDSGLSPLSPGARLAEANRQFDETYRRAQDGDIGAAEDLSDIGRALLEAERAYSASSPAYVATFNKVSQALQNTESLNERLAKNSTDQVTLLRGTLSTLQGQAANTVTVAEAAQAYLNAQAAVTTANGNVPSAAARGEQQFQAFQGLATDFNRLTSQAADESERANVYNMIAGQRDALINAITDVATLQRIGQTYYRGSNDSGAIAIKSRLYSLGAVPAFATGGSFMVGGIGGTDSQFVPFRATPGERVTVETPQQQAANDRAPAPINDNGPVVRAISNLQTALVRDLNLLRTEVTGLRQSHDALSNRLTELEARRDVAPLRRRAK